LWSILVLEPAAVGATGRRLKSRNGLEVHFLQHFLGIGINLNDVLLKGRDVRHIVVPSLSLLLLQFDGDTTDCGPLESLHEMGDEPTDLVSERLGGDEGDLLDDALVGVEVEGELGIVLLNYDPRGLLDRLCTDSAHIETSLNLLKCYCEAM